MNKARVPIMSFVSLEAKGSLAILRLNRPPVNAVNRQLAFDIHAALDELESGGVAKPFVFTGIGKAFCPGLDLREIPTYTAAEQREFIMLCNRTAARLYQWPAPVVGAINGHAMAAGFVLALTPDYRIGVEQGARFAVQEIKAGIPFPAVPLIIMNAELAPAVVRRLALTCAEASPQEACEAGVVDELVRSDQLEARALEVLHALAALPRDTYRRVKAQIRAAAYREVDCILNRDGDPLVDAWLSSETPAAATEALKR